MYAFTCLGVSDLIADIFRKIQVHSWSVAPSAHGKILACGEMQQKEFEHLFQKAWDCADFSADQVLGIIAFERAFQPIVRPDCL
ncbi:hypothetical protein MIR68_005322 [Amoeboaphelidium protococcarum]|nr:hypothetical protein MIR68_005322 [Amoeboaphelidium protococcarum]